MALSIGGISLGMTGHEGLFLQPEPLLRNFAVQTGPCDIEMETRWVETIEKPRRRALFESAGVWSLYEEAEGYAFYFSTPYLGPYKAAWFNREFTQGIVVLHRECFDGFQTVYPLEYPLDELLTVHRLARGEGVEVHACGLMDSDGRGYLFAGYSRSGKSTMARLWMKQPGARILSDARIILRERDGHIWMHGTPWHGDGGMVSPASARLDAIYFIERGLENMLEPITPANAAAALFARSFVPFHSPQALEFSLEFLERVSREIPCQTFQFVSNESAVETIRKTRK